MSATIKVRWLGEGSRTVQLPCPLISKSEIAGQVVCNPIGEFPEADGLYLIGLGGMWEAVDPLPVKQAPPDPDEWDENGPASARPPTDRPILAYRPGSKGVAFATAKRRGFVVRENPGSDKPWELWAPSPATEGAHAGAAISA